MDSLFFQTIIQTRVDFDEQGKPIGAPKLIKSWTTNIYGTKKVVKAKAVEIKATIGEEVEI
jgi:hypothetical protein